jgi:hypothetical protein
MVWTLAFPGFVPVQWTVVAIALGGGADGEGGLPLSPVSPGSATCNPPPRPACGLLPPTLPRAGAVRRDTRREAAPAVLTARVLLNSL